MEGLYMYYKERIGQTNGIFTLTKVLNRKHGLFYCSVCGDYHKARLEVWASRGRKRCGRMKTTHKLYDRYDKMLKRCLDKNNERYIYYGARGITVCERWQKSFDNFLEDMEPTFKEGLELDRIDNSKGYSPENCRWVTHSENMLNRNGFKNSTGYPGIRKNSASNKYHGRFQKNKKNYITKMCDTPEQAYEELQKLKQTL